METFYEMAVKIIGELPDTSIWIYDIGAIMLVLSAFLVFIIPISLMFKRFIGG